MTTASPIPAEAAPRMANPLDTTDEAPPAAARTRDRTTAARPTLRAQIAENQLLTFFGLVIIALLAAAIASPNIRIGDVHDRIGETNHRIDRLEDAMLAGFAAQDARMDVLDAKIDDKFGELDAKIDDKFGELDAKIDDKFGELDAKIDDKFGELDAKIDDKFGELDAKIDEMNLKFTALIAALNATEAVDAALDGRLVVPGADVNDSQAPRS